MCGFEGVWVALETIRTVSRIWGNAKRSLRTGKGVRERQHSLIFILDCLPIVCLLFGSKVLLLANAHMDKSAETSTIQQIRDKLMQTLKDREELVKENVELRQVRA